VVSFSEIGRRLGAARADQSISIDDVSRATGVPRQTLEQLERGEEASVSTAALARIAKHLGLRDTDLWSDNEPPTAALFFRHARVPDFFSDDSRVVHEALRIAETVRDVEDLIGRSAPLRAVFDAQPAKSPAYEDGYQLARQVRRALHLKGSLQSEFAPLPSDWEALIEDAFGIPILERLLATRGVLAVTAKTAEPPLAAIVMSSRHSGPALPRRVTVAHELAHALFDPMTHRATLFIDKEEDFSESRAAAGEQRARAFAAELLVPRGGLLGVLGAPDPTHRGVETAVRLVERAGKHFGSTPELTAHHLANNQYFPDALHDDVVRSVARWEYPEPAARKELLTRRVKQALEVAAISEGRARELLGLAAWDPLPP
jgi:transcriptional regulator with XRE-family HTH domain